MSPRTLFFGVGTMLAAFAHTRRRLLSLTIAVILTSLNVCHAGDGAAVNPAISPVDEIQLILPATSREFRPEAVVTGQKVEIPPAILVHKSYYSGDRDFRAQAFPGGPTLVVVQNPESGRQECLELQMPAGSPRVFYRRHWIDYHFGSQIVRIQFCHPLHPKRQQPPQVKYLKATSDLRQPALDCADTPAGQWFEKTGLPSLAKGSGGTAKALADSAAGGIRTVSETALKPIRQLRDSTILSRFASANPEEEARKLRDTSVREAQQQAERVSGSIPTQR